MNVGVMAQQPKSTTPQLWRRGVGVLLALDFIVTLAILITDKNLQTDFGATHPYYLHWYVLLVTALVDIVGAPLVYLKSSRRLIGAAAGWSVFMALFQVADIATYKLVGFATPSQFAVYLFGLTHYNGALPYIPGLYDILLLLYVATAAVSAQTLKRSS
ncbi:hypothetical protein B9Q03_13120 [Candidatus Marsarchaeota G2 archaeon OSP_D]|jgi:hypothetical protein|uniref:Uncharacterized protein n=6 Tax=Candidatus Marsarchaeota group 2 TaxID=2203771 RepID=A0A2R6C6M7_9ARCH|nr:MAG: hypothetical protein B9Q03_13120 [Candidatus Marsarchaeota G2 archaeon OSP_D]PSN91358.1 MAG: hypothetical protein B9Q08_03060 [Candidatus Marsarchaeota G2 archaeon ECH_B_SAG-M15]PSN96077.1 MAG: hypothetical protein B9Q06_03095 [Candidatus Marsarchaeota G2 archaeon ECH_B_2]PSO00227.1 MAG: hypothetical protein B9Q07_04715 [Candidatus Marsarchaeota G2 archaeon ECH_B_3]PSO02723.1 MAG: hypothetical protein B9Q05_04245 [Candidatus Marsarchaeota G2 archaeon ECH_B_1]PSO06553.1 MAG: hypothetica